MSCRTYSIAPPKHAYGHRALRVRRPGRQRIAINLHKPRRPSGASVGVSDHPGGNTSEVHSHLKRRRSARGHTWVVIFHRRVRGDLYLSLSASWQDLHHCHSPANHQPQFADWHFHLRGRSGRR